MATDDEVRAEVRSFLDDSWDPSLPLSVWRGILADSGWGCPTWPIEWYGRGLSPASAAIVTEEFRRVGAVGAALGVGMALAAPTLLAHGSAEIRSRLLRRTITGEDTWCQLFSEPGNGSDLAGVMTRAVRDGDEWVVNGQKVWTTGAHQAAYGLLLARTDPTAPKHRGISYFAFPMRQPGVEVRPLRQMNGRSSFNEVFITDAVVPDDHLVGELDGGWVVAQTTLSYERGLAASVLSGMPTSTEGRTAREAYEEAAAYLKTYEWYPQRAGRPDLAVTLATSTGASARPIVRDELAKLVSMERTARWNTQRGAATRARDGRPGPEGSVAKLASSEIARAASLAHTSVSGAHAMLTGVDSPADGLVAEVLVSVPGQSIAGGTDEIQHNIIGERVLGLPREPQADIDVPFNEVRSNASTRRTR